MSPFFLMFGRQARLPVDFLVHENDDDEKSYTEYIQDLRARLKKAHQIASNVAKTSQGKQKGRYDLKARAAVLQEGDKVLVKILAFDGRHKLSNKWEEEAYVVLKHPNVDIPVYIIQQEDGTSPTRKLHRNHLLPINYLPVNKSCEIGRSIMIKKRTKTCVPPAADCNDVKAVEDSDDDDLYDDDVPVIVTDHVPGNVRSVGTEYSSEEEGGGGECLFRNSTVSGQSTSSSRSETQKEDNVEGADLENSTVSNQSTSTSQSKTEEEGNEDTG